MKNNTFYDFELCNFSFVSFPIVLYVNSIPLWLRHWSRLNTMVMLADVAFASGFQNFV